MSVSSSKWNRKLAILKDNLRKLNPRLSRFEKLILFSIPLLITIFIFIPAELIQSLKLDLSHPKYWQYLTFGLTHTDFPHYMGNLVLYLIISGICVILASQMGEKRIYLNMLFFVTFTFSPLYGAYITIIYPLFGIDKLIETGASGLVSAIYGFIPIILAGLYSKLTRRRLLNINFLILILSYLGIFMGVVYLPIHKNFFLLLLLSAIFMVYLFLEIGNLKNFIGWWLDLSRKNVFLSIIIIFSIFLFLVLPLSIFPSNLISGEGYKAGFLSHLIGALYGIISSFIFFKLREKEWKITNKKD